MILQLRNRLKATEEDQEVALRDKNSSLEDLHRRLKQNVDCIQQLNHQLNNLNKENIRQRSLVEQELSARKSLQLQLEAKEQTIMGLRAQIEARSFTSPARDSSHVPNFDRSLRSSSRNGLTLQLQQSSSYWSDKVKDLSAQLDESNASIKA
uniref:Uncharacterized protein n=2 Tax=Ciona intestinalis TaxID=7719 RepID=H2XQH8_CIOIN